MIWLYLIATIVAQAIVVVLLIEFINRRSLKSDTPKEVEAPVPVEAEKPESTPPATPEDNPVGLSGFTYEKFRAMMKEVVKECIEERVEENDVEFDNKEEKQAKDNETAPDAPSARMTPEAESKVWEDNRDMEAQLDKEDDSVAPANPMATGAGFDEIAKASVIVETPEGRSLDDLQFAVRVYQTVDGTQFTGCLPDALLEKLRMCHERVEMKSPFPDGEKPEVAPEPPAPVEKPKRKPKEKPPVVQEPEVVRPTPMPRKLNFFSKQPSKQ